MKAGINAQQPGKIFDAVGNPHYTHADYQGSIIAVTDSVGTVVQTTNYYPYGEPWREPTGQPMLFAGKERTSNSDYLYGPRNLMSAALLWTGLLKKHEGLRVKGLIHLRRNFKKNM